MLMSRCEFSITLAASATFIEGAKCVPAVITDEYKSATFFPVATLEPEVTFNIFSMVCNLSPGLILSGEYPAKKSVLNSKPEIIINLQGDMPNLNPKAIKDLADYMKKNLCDIATLASHIENEQEKKDLNIVKSGLEDVVKFSKTLNN